MWKHDLSNILIHIYLPTVVVHIVVAFAVNIVVLHIVVADVLVVDVVFSCYNVHSQNNQNNLPSP